MKNVGWLFLAILIAYGCAGIAPLLRYGLRGRVGAFAGWCFLPIVVVCPLLIPSANVGLRAVAAFASGDITFKMVDYFRHWGNVERSRVLRDYYRFLIPFPVLSVVYPDHKRRLRSPESPWPQVLRVFGGIVGCTLALEAIRGVSGIALLRSSFRAEPCRDVADLRARHRIALASALRARTPGRIRHNSDYPERLPVANGLRVLATIQLPDS